MNKRLTWSLLVMFFCGTLSAQEPTVINIYDFGARPNDGKDDTHSLRKAAAYCRTHPGITLLFPAGVYELKDDDAIQLEREVMSGKYGNNPENTIYTPYFPYVKGLDFSGAKDLEIRAEGATLLCEGWMEPVSLVNCTNVRLTGLTIDSKNPPLSTGVVEMVTDDYFDVKFPETRQMTASMPYCRMTFWMKDKERLYPNSLYFPSKTILANNVVRFHHRISKELEGQMLGVVHSFHFRPAVLILESGSVALERVTIHAQPGMGIVGFDSQDITLRQVAVVPAPGRYFSTNTDATHFACCEGLLRIDNCRFQAQGDDATNVHGYYHSIEMAKDNHATIQLKARTYTHAQVLDAPRVGDELELVEVTTLRPVKTYKVEEVVRNEKKFQSYLTLSDTLPAAYSDYLLMNITKLPRVEFVNSEVNSHLARGVLIKSRNVTIRNNVFRYCTGTAIHVGAEAGWYEGSHAKDVTIANNLIIGCGSGDGSQGGASGIAVIIGADDTDKTYLHENIRLEGNTIVGENNPCGIYVGNASGVRLLDNQITGCKERILLHSVKDISID